MKKKVLLQFCLLIISVCACAQATVIKYLSGIDKDHTVQWDFYCTGGQNSGKWTKIAVPSNWEQQGFGSYNYGLDKVKNNEQGMYKCRFNMDAGKLHGNVILVFEGSMTDTEVKINGQSAGATHQGSFYRFKYDITALLKPGENLLEATVSKTSANNSVNHAERNGDFWIFGGIYRPVYLQILPKTYINRVAIDAKGNGTFHMDVYSQNLTANQIIEAQVQTLGGVNVGKAFSVKTNEAATKPGIIKDSDVVVELTSKFDSPLLWNAETPNLYQVVVSIKGQKGIIHKLVQKLVSARLSYVKTTVFM
jgi:beta-galactosidase/beta-glucuronidase